MCTHDDYVSTAAGAVHHSSVVGLYTGETTDRDNVFKSEQTTLVSNQSST